MPLLQRSKSEGSSLRQTTGGRQRVSISESVKKWCNSHHCWGQKNQSSPEEEESNNNNHAKKTKEEESKPRSKFKSFAFLAFIPVLLGALVQYYGGVNELMIAIMGLEYKYYGKIHGGKPVYADTEYGRLKGFTSYSREGRKFYEFLGIQYARPPTGQLRFKAPVPPSSWEGVRDANAFGHACTQYDLFLQAVMGEEDCLTLNIYTPNLNKTEGKRLPVLLFIHGGMYHFGRAMDFKGNHFMDEPVVVVTINYRLQAFGFLNTGDGEVRGNMGLKDQVMAMKYVKNNIHNFGGDPGLVTIWGESAGGASTQLHTLSPMSKGLFHRAISNSGFSLAHWSFIRKPKEQAKIFAKTLGCPTESTKEMVHCLRKISAYKIGKLFRGNHDVLHPRLEVFAPTIESGSPQENDTETFLSAHPRDLLRRGEIVSRVPMINGANSHEGLIYAGYFVRNQTIANSLNSEWHKHSPVLLDFEDLPEETRDEVASKIWKFYLGDKTVGMDTLYEMVNLFSDIGFFKPMEEGALAFGKHMPLYMYLYNHHGEFGVAQGFFRITMKLPMTLDGLIFTGVQMFNRYVFGIEEKHYGVCHADEMALFFKMHPFLSRIDPGHKEFDFSKELVKSWAHFAEHGQPLQFREHTWLPVIDGQPLKYMKLDSKKSPGMVFAPWHDRIKFLNTLPGFQCIQEYGNIGTRPICI